MFRTRATETLKIGKRRLRDIKCEHEWRIPENFSCVKDVFMTPAHSFPKQNRLFSTTTKGGQKSARNARKKKSLVQSSKKITTKDRLRLSTRPSSSTKKTKNKDGDDLMIKSPEELMERLNTGLDMARKAAKEGYATLRNPKPGDNHLLPARPTSSGSSGGSRPAPPEGLVMDANWWFWNLLFAASPAILIGVYCEFIVKPEMKARSDELDKEERAKSLGSEQGSSSESGSAVDSKKMSSMRMRQQEEQKQKKQKSPNDKAATSIEVEGDGTNAVVNANGIQQQEKEVSFETQQQELNELQLKLQQLQDQIIRQQRERADSNSGNDSEVSGDTSASPTKRNSLSSIGKFVKGTTAAGITIGRERFSSLVVWLRGQGPPHTSNGQIVPTNAEKPTEKSDDSVAKVSKD